MFGHALATFLTIDSSSNHRNRRPRGASDRQSCTTSPRSDWVEFGYQDEEPGFSSTPVAGAVAVPAEYEVPMLYPREISDTTTAICLRSEIAESVDGNPVDNGNNKRPSSFAFDIFAEGDDNGLAGARRRPTKRRLRDSTSLQAPGEV
jgi:hypothetical protein